PRHHLRAGGRPLSRARTGAQGVRTMSFKITYSVVNADMSELNRAFDAALADVKGRLGQTFPSWIDGKPLEPGRSIESRSPVDTSVVIARFHAAGADDVDRAMDAAKRAQAKWARTPWEERARILVAGAELISKRRMEMSAVCTLEVGKNRMEGLGDVEEA